MNAKILSAIPMVAALAMAPAQAQISGRVHIDLPIGRQPPAGYSYRMPREVFVYEYAPRWAGPWESTFFYWQPITLYFYQGRYYERPFRNARPVYVFRYHNRIFFPPRDGKFDKKYGKGRGRGNWDDVRGCNTGPDQYRNDGRYGGRARPR